MADAVVRPIRAFEDNVAPAQLMLDVYRLLDCGDAVQTDGDFVRKVRQLVEAQASEHLMVVQNEIFLGIVREKARLAPAQLKLATLLHLLRQAVVVSCTALESYLPALLRMHLPIVISRRGRAFFPSGERTVVDYFKEVQFKLDDLLRVMTGEEDPSLYLSNRLLGAVGFKYLSGSKGITVTCALLAIAKPWEALAVHLARDEEAIKKALDDTVRRRNDIIHRADRASDDPGGAQTPITYSQADQGVHTIVAACHAVNELVEARIRELDGAS